MASADQILAAELLRARVPDALSFEGADVPVDNRLAQILASGAPASRIKPAPVVPSRRPFSPAPAVGQFDVSLPPPQNTGQAPVRQDISGRPKLDSLYSRLMELTDKPVDYSALAQINKASQAAAHRDYLGGLGLVMFGDSGMRQAGQHVLEKALEAGKPLRPNAADTAYINQDTGEVIQNPHEEKLNKRHVLEYAIKKLEEEQKLREQAANKADQDRRHAELQVALGNARNNTNITIKQMGTDSAAELAALKAGGKADKPKTLSRSEAQDLLNLSKNYENLKNVEAQFTDEFSKGIGGKFQVEMGNYFTNTIPEIRDAVTSKKTQEAMDARARWWKSHDYYNVLPERHEMFGSALTAPERAAWAAATITPGMKPAEIRYALSQRRQLMERAADRIYRLQQNNQKDTAAVRAGLAAFKHLLPADEETPAAPPTPAGSSGFSIRLKKKD